MGRVMDTTRRTKIFIEGDRKLLARLTEQIEQRYDVRVERKAQGSLAMARARDSVTHQPFNVGEILLTECTVAIGDIYGFGAVMGEDRTCAYELAVMDAAFRAGLPETNLWTELLVEEEERIRNRHAQELAIAMRTRVDFGVTEGAND